MQQLAGAQQDLNGKVTVLEQKHADLERSQHWAEALEQQVVGMELQISGMDQQILAGLEQEKDLRQHNADLVQQVLGMERQVTEMEQRSAELALELSQGRASAQEQVYALEQRNAELAQELAAVQRVAGQELAALEQGNVDLAQELAALERQMTEVREGAAQELAASQLDAEEQAAALQQQISTLQQQVYTLQQQLVQDRAATLEQKLADLEQLNFMLQGQQQKASMSGTSPLDLEQLPFEAAATPPLLPPCESEPNVEDGTVAAQLLTPVTSGGYFPSVGDAAASSKLALLGARVQQLEGELSASLQVNPIRSRSNSFLLLWRLVAIDAEAGGGTGRLTAGMPPSTARLLAYSRQLLLHPDKESHLIPPTVHTFHTSGSAAAGRCTVRVRDPTTVCVFGAGGLAGCRWRRPSGDHGGDGGGSRG